MFHDDHDVKTDSPVCHNISVSHQHTSHHATIGALVLGVPCQTCQRFLILCVNQLTNAAVQGILGVGVAKLALTGSMQHGYGSLVATIFDAELRISQVLKNAHENVCFLFPVVAEAQHNEQTRHVITMQMRPKSAT